MKFLICKPRNELINRNGLSISNVFRHVENRSHVFQNVFYVVFFLNLRVQCLLLCFALMVLLEFSFVSFLAQVTMSARAFPITMCPSSVRLSGCPSVRPLDYFSKPISSYSFSRIASKFNTGIKYDVTNLACAFF